MKIISWICQGAFRKKADLILTHQPDILLVQECEDPDKLIYNPSTKKPNDFVWRGDNPNKGLGVFSFSKFRFNLLGHNTELKTILPIAVTEDNLILLYFLFGPIIQKTKRTNTLNRFGKQ
ncbi:MAG: hypothetical protein ABI707_03665 [Ferruginibacter sp.]